MSNLFVKSLMTKTYSPSLSRVSFKIVAAAITIARNTEGGIFITMLLVKKGDSLCC